MNPFGLGGVVRVVNRVRDAEGNPVPVEIRLGGDAMWVQDTLDMPSGMARIAIQQTMYKMDPVTSRAHYKLGCKALNAPEDLIRVEDTLRTELIERELLAPDRQFGSKDARGRTLKPTPVYNPINYRASAPQPGPRPNEDGAMPGEFGDRR